MNIATLWKVYLKFLLGFGEKDGQFILVWNLSNNYEIPA